MRNPAWQTFSAYPLHAPMELLKDKRKTAASSQQPGFNGWDPKLLRAKGCNEQAWNQSLRKWPGPSSCCSLPPPPSPPTRPTAVPSTPPGLAAGRPEREALAPLSGHGSEQQDPASLSSRGERLRPHASEMQAARCCGPSPSYFGETVTSRFSPGAQVEAWKFALLQNTVERKHGNKGDSSFRRKYFSSLAFSVWVKETSRAHLAGPKSPPPAGQQGGHAAGRERVSV